MSCYFVPFFLSCCLTLCFIFCSDLLWLLSHFFVCIFYRYFVFTMSLALLKYHYEFMDLNMFFMFQSITATILINYQVILSLPSRNFFRLMLESLRHNPVIFVSFLPSGVRRCLYTYLESMFPALDLQPAISLGRPSLGFFACSNLSSITS